MLASPDSMFLDIEGPIHVADYGGPAGARTLVCLPGLGNSHVSWRAFAAQLTDSYRVLAVDLPGQGRSPLLGRSAGVLASGALLPQVLAELAPEPVTLVGHSMGAAVAVLAAADDRGAIDNLVLLAPPMPRFGTDVVSPALASHVALCLWPWLARRSLQRRLHRLGVEQFVERGLRLTCASLDDLDTVVQELAGELQAARAAGENPAAVFVEAARSLGVLVTRAHGYRAALSGLTLPGTIVHGAADRVLPPSRLVQVGTLQPRWRTHVLEGVGHSPHMEAPERTADVVRQFLDRHDRALRGHLHTDRGDHIDDHFDDHFDDLEPMGA